MKFSYSATREIPTRRLIDAQWTLRSLSQSPTGRVEMIYNGDGDLGEVLRKKVGFITDPVRSMADFTWCMTAIDWGWSIEEAAKKLPEVSEKAREKVRLRDEGYPLITAQNAAAEVAMNDLKRSRG